MNRIRFTCAVTLLLGALASGSVAAHGSVHFGIGIGVPLYPPAYYYPPPAYYYPPAVIAAPAAQPVYVEQSPQQAAPPPEQFWYYCAESKTYYPYVKECRSPWQRVPARPAP